MCLNRSFDCWKNNLTRGLPLRVRRGFKPLAKFVPWWTWWHQVQVELWGPPTPHSPLFWIWVIVSSVINCSAPRLPSSYNCTDVLNVCRLMLPRSDPCIPRFCADVSLLARVDLIDEARFLDCLIQKNRSQFREVVTARYLFTAINTSIRVPASCCRNATSIGDGASPCRSSNTVVFNRLVAWSSAA